MSSVLVSGADGFIGSHLAETCVRAGKSVRALAQYNSTGSAGWLDSSPLREDMEIILGDVRDAEWCRTVTKNVDEVFHLAALIAVPYSYLAPRSYMETNVTGTLNMCQGALESGVQRFIQMSSSEVYGSARFIPITEDHPLAPQSPYAASKVGADAVARSFHCSFELPLCLARPFNTFGPRQSRRAFIPSVIAQILAKSKSIVIGNSAPRRDLTYVTDTAKALLLLSDRGPMDGSVINVGTGSDYSVGEVISVIQEVAGVSMPVVQDESRFRPSGSEVDRLLCDPALLNSAVGYTPDTTLRQGLEWTIQWMSTVDVRVDEWHQYAI